MGLDLLTEPLKLAEALSVSCFPHLSHLRAAMQSIPNSDDKLRCADLLQHMVMW